MTFRITSIIILASIIFLSCNYQPYQYSTIQQVNESKENSNLDSNLESNLLTEDDFVDLSSAGNLEPLDRRTIKIPNLGSLMTKKGIGEIVVKICINPQGDVVYAKVVRDETTITDRYILKNALLTAKKYKFEKDINAPREECGKYVFKLDIEN